MQIGPFVTAAGRELPTAHSSCQDEHFNRKQGGQHEGLIQLWGIKTWEEKMAKWVFGGDNGIPSWVGLRGS